MNQTSIVVENASKRFRIVTIPKRITLKEAVVKFALFKRAQA